MMTDQEFLQIKAKIEKEFPIRIQLGKLAGVQTKNHLSEFDFTLFELLGMIAVNNPQQLPEAIRLHSKAI